MAVPKWSEKDSRGYWYVACCECQRGGNGDADCSAGWQVKKGSRTGCFAGTFLNKFKTDEDQPENNTEE